MSLRPTFRRILSRETVASASLLLYVSAAAPFAPVSTVRGVVAGTRFTPPLGDRAIEDVDDVLSRRARLLRRQRQRRV